MDEPIALEPGEEILWAGRPDPRAHFSRWDWFLIPFSIAWLGFTIFWLVRALSAAAPLIAIAFGVAFVLFGMYLCVGRFVVKARSKAATRYWITTSEHFPPSGSHEPAVTAAREAAAADDRDLQSDEMLFAFTGREIIEQTPFDRVAIDASTAPHVVTLSVGTNYHYISRAGNEDEFTDPPSPRACSCSSGGTCECPGG